MTRRTFSNSVAGIAAHLVLLIALLASIANAQTSEADPMISVAMRDTDLAEVMEMLSRTERVNILLSDGVEADVSFSLYDVPLSEAIRSIATSAGYAVERRHGMYFIVNHEEAGAYAESDLTEIQAFPIQYADPAQLQSMLSPYLSKYGQLTVLVENKMLVVEDTPEFLRRIAKLIREVDRQPRQILIEAKILEVTLNEEDSYGIDWRSFFESNGGEGSFGTRGLQGIGESGTQGLFFELTTEDLTVMLSALEQDGRIRTLSTPKLLALEYEEASVIVGDRRGYRVTTTINQVTTESIEFLESGVILRVTPHVDHDGRVMMDIHPEVSTGGVDVNGIPSQTTTEVTTRLLVESGQTIFIGGLIKQTLNETRSGVPILGRVPGIGLLFSSRELTAVNTETIVIITPQIVGETGNAWDIDAKSEVEALDRKLQQRSNRIDEQLNQTFISPNSPGQTDSIAESN
jgi:type II secretory pathway component GspD/PulD (secretin)